MVAPADLASLLPLFLTEGANRRGNPRNPAVGQCVGFCCPCARSYGRMVVAPQCRPALTTPTRCHPWIPSTPLAPRLEPVLRRLRQRIRRMLASRGALITAVTALAGLLALVALDLAVRAAARRSSAGCARWSGPPRWPAWPAVWWWLPLRQPLDLIRIARWLEIHHPELDERISTVLEVAGHDDSATSLQLLDELAKHAVRSLDQINPQVEVSNRRVRHWLWPAAALFRHLGRVVRRCGRRSPRAMWCARWCPRPPSATPPAASLVTPGSRELFEG